uniref:Cytochrome c oxidase subunit 2 n=1 Tax=Allonautilus scrobiculatus TaxID=34575 RepID=A0A0F6T5X1_9MOLL|nr:cytochrome c oxidase subunit II [Allonautilus scrobiculatus]AKE32135.1 cytochrome c oxidase subunit II [Allonautilus scrobiculatus]
MALWGQIKFQDASSPLMEQLILFHDHAMFVLVMITALVGYISSTLIANKTNSRMILEGQKVETIWTIVPAIILIFLALPSLRLLYLLDEVNDPLLSIKVVGHQWYWSYEYSDFLNVEFDSYMIPTNELQVGTYRLLEVDNRLIVPMKTNIRALVSSADVLHAWTLPSMGIKLDAVPGRLNQVSFLSQRPGVSYGQCSEICGANHSFMPIAMESVNIPSFLLWLSKNI